MGVGGPWCRRRSRHSGRVGILCRSEPLGVLYNLGEIIILNFPITHSKMTIKDFQAFLDDFKKIHKFFERTCSHFRTSSQVSLSDPEPCILKFKPKTIAVPEWFFIWAEFQRQSEEGGS